MGKIDVPDAIKAVSAFMGSAHQARNEERDRQAYRQQWEQTHALNLAADRRAQERLEMERKSTKIRDTMNEVDLYFRLKDEQDKAMVRQEITRRIGGDPDVLKGVMAYTLDNARIEGQNLSNLRQKKGMQREDTLWQRSEDTRNLLSEITGMPPEKMDALLQSEDYQEAMRGYEKSEFEHDQWKTGQAAAILEETFPRRTTPVGAQGYAAKSDLVNARQQYESSKREEMVPGEIKTRYGDSPEQIAAERSLGLGQTEGGGTNPYVDMLKQNEAAINAFRDSNMTKTVEGTYDWKPGLPTDARKALEAALDSMLSRQSELALLASGAVGMSGSGDQTTNPAPAPPKTKEKPKAEDLAGYDPEKETWEAPLYTQDTDYGSAFGNWLGWNYPGFVNSLDRAWKYHYGPSGRPTPPEQLPTARAYREWQRALEEKKKKPFQSPGYTYGK